MLKKYVPDYSNPFTYNKAAHLLRRCMIGPKHSEILESVKIGLDATIENLFKKFNPSTDYIKEWAGKDCQSARPLDDTEYITWFWDHYRRVQMFYQWWIMNIRDSPVSIQERLVLFWHNNFATDIRLNIQFAHIIFTQYQLLQKMSLGNFRDFVKNITRNVAMQLCLSLHNNYVNGDKKYINENYAREMLELHTVGIFNESGERNYTQKDVFEAARGLTGWFTKPSELGPLYNSNESMFIENRWDSGEKTFLGKTGNWKTNDIIDILFQEKSKEIAIKICTKLYCYFVADEPDMEVVHILADDLIALNWEIEPVLKTLVSSEHFFDKNNIGILKKSHIEYISGMIRQFKLENIPDLFKEQNRYGDLIIRLQGLGQLMYNPPNVSGWTGKRDWVNSSALPRRLQFAKDVVYNQLLTISNPVPPAIYTYDIFEFASNFESIDSPTQLAKDFVSYLLPDEFSDTEMNEFVSAILDGGTEIEWNINDPKQRTDERMKKCLEHIVLHPSFQLF